MTKKTSMKKKLKNNTLKIHRVGIEDSILYDTYHRLLMMSWPRFFALFFIIYISLNVVFGFLFFLLPGSVANIKDGDFLSNFSFSVQTFSTVGYGYFYPVTTSAHLLVALESAIGLLSTALSTGMVFVKFAKPNARVVFSNRVLWSAHNGQDVLVVRLGNVRTNRVFEGRARMTLLRDETTIEGEKIRRLVDLKLLRNETPLFAMSWTLYHPIDDESPFRGMSVDKLRNLDWQIIVTFSGLDEDVAQTITAHSIFSSTQFVQARKFADMIQTQDGIRQIDFSKLHDMES